MAAPNIVGVTTITGKTTYLSLANTSETALLTNASSSGKVFKVNSIIVANDNGTGAADITVTLYDDASGGNGYKLAHTISVAADSTLVVLDKASSVYLEENKRITVTASTGNYLDVVCSYEEIS
jgi:hypothetical protein